MTTGKDLSAYNERCSGDRLRGVDAPALLAGCDIERGYTAWNGTGDYYIAYNRERRASAAGIFSDPKSPPIVEAEAIDFAVDIADERFAARNNRLSAPSQREGHSIRHVIIHTIFGSDAEIVGPGGIRRLVAERSLRSAPDPAGAIRRRHAARCVCRAARIARELRPVLVVDPGRGNAGREAQQKQRSMQLPLHIDFGSLIRGRIGVKDTEFRMELNSRNLAAALGRKGSIHRAAIIILRRSPVFWPDRKSVV